MPSALIHIANAKILHKFKPLHLKKVLFCGEVMPNKHLNIWRKNLPEVVYVNLYGPTEAVEACTYFVIDREFQDCEPLPIGKACDNTTILVLNENDELILPCNAYNVNSIAIESDIGELCIRGSCLASGYYNNEEKTKEVFVQNPSNKSYSEIIYRTGDLVKYNDLGELIYLCRKDYQIKHMGYRIELGEIEMTAYSIHSIEKNCVLNRKRQTLPTYFIKKSHAIIIL